MCASRLTRLLICWCTYYTKLPLAPPSPPAKQGWSEGVTLDGNKYYINHITKTTTWDRPTAQAETANQAVPSSGGLITCHTIIFEWYFVRFPPIMMHAFLGPLAFRFGPLVDKEINAETDAFPAAWEGLIFMKALHIDLWRQHNKVVVLKA